MEEGFLARENMPENWGNTEETKQANEEREAGPEHTCLNPEPEHTF